jgi:hypothetical protein
MEYRVVFLGLKFEKFSKTATYTCIFFKNMTICEEAHCSQNKTKLFYTELAHRYPFSVGNRHHIVNIYDPKSVVWSPLGKSRSRCTWSCRCRIWWCVVLRQLSPPPLWWWPVQDRKLSQKRLYTYTTNRPYCTRNKIKVILKKESTVQIKQSLKFFSATPVRVRRLRMDPRWFHFAPGSGSILLGKMDPDPHYELIYRLLNLSLKFKHDKNYQFLTISSA